MNIFAAQMNISGKSEVSFIPLGVVVCLILCKPQFLYFIILCREPLLFRLVSLGLL